MSRKPGRILPGTFNYYAASADVRHYLPISERLVIANRVQLGDLEPVDDIQGNVPFPKKYFLGGATSVRGWGRYEISPLSESGLPVGGQQPVRVQLRGARRAHRKCRRRRLS